MCNAVPRKENGAHTLHVPGMAAHVKLTPAPGYPFRPACPRNFIFVMRTCSQRAQDDPGRVGNVQPAGHAVEHDAGQAVDGQQVGDEGVTAPAGRGLGECVGVRELGVEAQGWLLGECGSRRP